MAAAPKEQTTYVGRPSRAAKIGSYVFGLLLMIAAPIVWIWRPGFLAEAFLFTYYATVVAWTLGFIGFVIVIRAEIARLTTKYTITSMRVIRRDGLVRRHTQYVLFNKIERVAVEQGLIDRLLNIGDLIVDTGDDFLLLWGIRGPKEVEIGIAKTLSQRGRP